MRSVVKIVIVIAVSVTPMAALAGKGASYGSLRNAINSRSPDTIVAELERAEKLPCLACLDLVGPLIDDDNARVRDAAAWWLSKRAIRVKVRDDMFARLQSGDPIKARNAAEVLGRFLHPDALMPLEMAMHDAALGDEARVAAAQAIAHIGDHRGKVILEAALTSESADVRAAAARGLRGIRGNLDGVALVTSLSDGDTQVVREAALTLGALREPAAVAALLDIVSSDNEPEAVRRDAAWALGRIGDGSARDALLEVSREDASMLVRGAARAAYHSLR